MATTTETSKQTLCEMGSTLWSARFAQAEACGSEGGAFVARAGSMCQASAVVGYGIDCYNDSHCDDINDCTTDSCVSNACQHSDLSSGTPCDDGLFCTATDTCDGVGTCVGSRSTPCPIGWTCDEIGDRCLENPN